MTDGLTGIKQKSAVQRSGVGSLLYAMASLVWRYVEVKVADGGGCGWRGRGW